MDIFNILKILGLFNSGFKSPHPKFWKALKFSFMGFPGGSDGKESACSPGDLSLISGLGRFPREGNGNPVQFSCLGNPMDREAGGCSLGDRKESDKTKHSTAH